MINSILNLFCDYVSTFYVVVKVLIITVLPSQSCKILPGSVINHYAGFWLLISLQSMEFLDHISLSQQFLKRLLALNAH